MEEAQQKSKRGCAFAIKIFVGVFVGLVLLVVLAVWLGMRFGVPRVAGNLLSEVTGEEVTIGKIGFYPFSGSAHLRDVRIGDKFGLDSMDAKVDVAAAAGDRFNVEFVKIAGIRGTVTRQPDGSLDLPISEEFKQAAPSGGAPPETAPEPMPAGDMPALLVSLVEVIGGPFTFVDHMAGGLETSVSDLNVTVTDLSTAPPPEGEEGADFSLSAKLGPGDIGTVTVVGVTDRPAGDTLKATVNAVGLDMAHFSPYIPPTSPVVPESGRMDVTADIEMYGTFVEMDIDFAGYALKLGPRDPALAAAFASALEQKPEGEEIAFSVQVSGDTADPAYDIKRELREAIVRAVQREVLGGKDLQGEVEKLLGDEMKDLPQGAKDALKGLLGK